MGGGPFDGTTIKDWGREAACQLEVLGRADPGAPEGFGTSLEALLMKCNLIGDRTFSSTLRDETEADFSFDSRCTDFFCLAGLVGFRDLVLQSSLKS